MEKQNKIIIYGLLKNNQYHYIGKINKYLNENNSINNSDISYQYHNLKLREIFLNKDTEIIQLEILNENDKWFDLKLLEIVDKHNSKHPLLNVQWMKDGKRGFWDGTDGFWKNKKRDQNTITKLSESKFKKIVQYDINGNLEKIWNSGKEVSIKIFNDYMIVNGSGKTKLYTILKRLIHKRLYNNSYWFTYEELIKLYDLIPIKINLTELKNNYQNNRPKKIKNQGIMPKYIIIEYDENSNEIKKYLNSYEAAKELNISYNSIRRICRTNKPMKNKHKLKYGEKIK